MIYLVAIFLSIIFEVHTFTVTTKSSTTSEQTVQAATQPSALTAVMKESKKSRPVTVAPQQGTSTLKLKNQEKAASEKKNTASSWTVQIANTNVPTLYTSPGFTKIQQNLNQLSQVTNNLIASFKLAKQQTKVTWGVSSSSISQSSLKSNPKSNSNTSLPVARSNFDYVQTYSTFQQCMTSPGISYAQSVQSIYQIYQNLYPAFTAYMQESGQQVGPSSQTYFSKYPFQANSYFLSLLQSIITVMIKYLTARVSLLNASNYTDNEGSSDLFGPTGAFRYCDALVSGIQTFTTQAFASVSAIQGISSSEVTALQTNFALIFNSYVQQKNTLVMEAVFNVLQSLVQSNPSNLVGPTTINTPVATVPLEIFMEDAGAAIEVLEQMMPKEGSTATKSPTAFLTYASPVAALAAAHGMMQSLYTYNSKILVVALEKASQNCNTLPYSITDPAQVDFQTKLLQVFSLLQQTMSNAASNAAAAGDVSSYALYMGQSNMAASVIGAWQNGQASYSMQSYVNALSYFNSVLTAVKQYNYVNFSNYTITMIQKINLEYAQRLFGMYVRNQSYITALSTYISNAISTDVTTYEADQELWCSLWYPQASPTPQPTASSIYQGFYPLCSSAVQTIQNVLSCIQNNQLSVPVEQAEQLQNSIQVLTPLVKGLEEMLVQGSLFSDGQSADSNMYVNYYTPSGYRQAYKQYQLIVQSFDAVDQACASYKSAELNPYAPLKQLLVGDKIVPNFGTLARLHYARWAFCMGMYAISYASSKTCTSDKTCIVYQNTSYQYALCALVDAQRIYTSLGHTTVASFIGQQIASINKYASGLSATAQSVLSTKNTTVSDKAAYDALYYLQVAAIVDPKNFGSAYKAQLQTLMAQESSNAFSKLFPFISLAYLAYQEYLWAVARGDTQTQKTSLATIQTELRKLTTQIVTLQNQIASTTITSAQAIASVNQLQAFQTMIQSLAIDQKYQQGILGISKSDFVAISDTIDDATFALNKGLAFIEGSSLLLSNVTYTLAQLYVQQGDQLLAQLETNVQEKKYTAIDDTVFTTITAGYKSAIGYYGSLGFSDDAAQVNISVSRLMALYYYSLVIPVDAPLAGANSNTAVSGKSTFEEPVYLMRYNQQNITSCKSAVDQNVMVAQQQKNSALIKNAMAQQAAYAQIQSAAQSLVGSNNTQAIISQVVIPLYRQMLLAGGYQNAFKTIDQQLAEYTTQLQGVITTGVLSGGVSYKTKFSLVEEKNVDGTTHLLLKSYFMPISPLPCFSTDTANALILYIQYQSFFAQTTQPIQTQNGVFTPIPDAAVYKSAQQAINQTYLAASNMYNNYIANLLAPLRAIKNPVQASFSDYAAVYSKFINVYEEILGYYSALEHAQESTNVLSYNVSNLYASRFQEYGDNAQLFIIGAPTLPDYIARVAETAVKYLLITNYTLDPAIMSKIYIKAANVYKTAGDMATLFKVPLPASQGYPNPAATNYPGPVEPVKSLPGIKCSTNIIPKTLTTSPIVFYAYPQAQGFYQQALQNYRQAYACAHNNKVAAEISDPNVRATWALYLMSSIKYAVQNSALFARSAVGPVNDPLLCDFTNQFLEVQTNGQNASGITAIKGYSSVTGAGPAVAGNAYAGNQYFIMKKLLLDSLIYLSCASSVCNNIALSANVVTAKNNINGPALIMLGSAYICCFSQYFPSLTAMNIKGEIVPLLGTYGTTSQKGEGSVSSFDISASLSIRQQYSLFHSDGFVQFNDYLMSSILGTAQNSFNGLQNKDAILAISAYITQLYGTIRNIYSEAFLPQLVAAAATAAMTGASAAQTAISNLQNSINTDIRTAQQTMLVDPAGYVG